MSQLVRRVRRPALVVASAGVLLLGGLHPVLSGAIVLFLLLHSRIDRQDPKVGGARLEEDDGLTFRPSTRRDS